MTRSGVTFSFGRRSFRALAFTALLCGVSGCFGQNGDEPKLSADYKSADGAFRLVYSSPPWREVSVKDRSVGLQIDAELFGISLGDSVPPTHVLLATTVSLDEHLKDLIDPKDLAKSLKQFGIDESQIPDQKDWNLSGIDTSALSSWTHTLNTDISTETSTGTSNEGKKNKKAKLEQPKPKVEIPEYLVNVDLKNPRDVAVAELNYLVKHQKARLVDGMQYFETDQGLRAVSYQLVIDPGIFVRNLYVPTKGNALRVGLMSMFKLTSDDFDRLLAAVFTDAEVDSPKKGEKQ